MLIYPIYKQAVNVDWMVVLGEGLAGEGVPIPFQNLLVFPCFRNYFQNSSQIFDP